MTLFRIAGLEKVWAVAEVPEAQAVRLTRGQKVKAVLQADASQTFSGEMKEILPQVNASTRTLQARFEVDNKGGRLVPGMLLRLQVAGPTVSRLVVPVGGGHPHRHPRSGHRAQGQRQLRAARGEARRGPG